MRVIVTGSRDADEQEVRDALEHFWFERAKRMGGGKFTRELMIVQGGCPTGADRAAREWARLRNITAETHEADWDLHGPAAGPLRNKRMVEAGARLCLAYPLREGESRGTWGCIHLCVEAGIKVEVWGVARAK